DMAVIGEFARQLGCPTPMFDATVPVYAEAMKSGHAQHDTAAGCALLETEAGVKRRKKASRPRGWSVITLAGKRAPRSPPALPRESRGAASGRAPLRFG